MKKSLAFILRPETIKDIIGQSHIINDDQGLISRMLKNDFVSSLIFYGNPGIGKSSIALALANDFKIPYQIFNATLDKKSDLERIIKTANAHNRYIIIIEEIHRLNRDKQDILLQSLEQGHLIMFACTTENPFFTINPAIRSRSHLVTLRPISSEEMFFGLKRIFKHRQEQVKLNLDDACWKLISQIANGDLRIALNICELLINLYAKEKITLQIIKTIAPISNMVNAHYGDEHHDLKSALQKSVRGSDVDATLHYLARLLATGDYEALLRRLLIMAYEDIGVANPPLVSRVKLAIDSFRNVGMPEGIIILGTIAVEMALSEKSNSAYLAIDKAYKDVINEGKSYSIPKHLRDNHYKSAKKFGHGIGYQYPHKFKNHYVEQQYLPDELKNTKYYQKESNSVYERRVNDLYENFIKESKKTSKNR